MTPQQKSALDFISARLVSTGIAPSYVEIEQELGFSSKSGVHRVLGALVRQGHLIKHKGQARGLELPTINYNVDLSRVPTDILRAEIERRLA